MLCINFRVKKYYIHYTAYTIYSWYKKKNQYSVSVEYLCRAVFALSHSLYYSDTASVSIGIKFHDTFSLVMSFLLSYKVRIALLCVHFFSFWRLYSNVSDGAAGYNHKRDEYKKWYRRRDQKRECRHLLYNIMSTKAVHRQCRLYLLYIYEKMRLKTKSQHKRKGNWIDSTNCTSRIHVLRLCCIYIKGKTMRGSSQKLYVCERWSPRSRPSQCIYTRGCRLYIMLPYPTEIKQRLGKLCSTKSTGVVTYSLSISIQPITWLEVELLPPG